MNRLSACQTSIAYLWTQVRINFAWHPKMVTTRGSSTRSKIIAMASVKVGVRDPGPLSEPPRKKQKHHNIEGKQKDISTPFKAQRELTAVKIEHEAKGIAKKEKRLKKVLQTMHTEDALPILRKKASRIFTELMELYEDPPCPLDHANPFQLLCSVILSAQSTDKKVNEVVPALYEVAPDAASMAQLEVGLIEDKIRKIGLAPTKAKNISKMSKALVERHDGHVPETFEELEQLAGVGHKTASVVMAVAFRKPTFPVDTHIYRLGLRWGLTAGNTVEQAEADLKACWPEEHWNQLHLRLIYYGREHCLAQRHDPKQCHICSWAAVSPYNQ